MLRGLGVSFGRRLGWVQLVLGSGMRAVLVRSVELKQGKLLSARGSSSSSSDLELKQGKLLSARGSSSTTSASSDLLLPAYSTHGLVFQLEKEQGPLQVQVDAVIDGRAVDLAFESADEGGKEEETGWGTKFAFKRLPCDQPQQVILQFRLHLPRSPSPVLLVHYAQNSSIVSLSGGKRTLSLPGCGYVQWTEHFRILSAEPELTLQVYGEGQPEPITKQVITL